MKKSVIVVRLKKIQSLLKKGKNFVVTLKFYIKMPIIEVEQ